MKKAYEQDEFFKKWLVGLSERTKENYSNGIRGWIAFIELSPTEQIKKRMRDLTSQDLTERLFFEGKFLAYKEHLEQNSNLKPIAVKRCLFPLRASFRETDCPSTLSAETGRQRKRGK